MNNWDRRKMVRKAADSPEGRCGRGSSKNMLANMITMPSVGSRLGERNTLRSTCFPISQDRGQHNFGSRRLRNGCLFTSVLRSQCYHSKVHSDQHHCTIRATSWGWSSQQDGRPHARPADRRTGPPCWPPVQGQAQRVAGSQAGPTVMMLASLSLMGLVFCCANLNV